MRVHIDSMEVNISLLYDCSVATIETKAICDIIYTLTLLEKINKS